jgi:microcystin-dependent protein
MANLGNINVGTGGGLFIGTVNINNLDASNNAMLYSSDGKRVQGLNKIKYDPSNNNLNFSGVSINTTSTINSSGDINTSGNVTCNTINGTLVLTNINISGYINASGNINTSGTITGTTISGTSFVTNGTINASGNINTSGNVTCNTINGSIILTNVNTPGSVNASGNINTSGNITVKNYVIQNDSSNNIKFASSGSLGSITTGSHNIAFGNNTLASIAIGDNNIAIGNNSLSVNTSSDNVAIGSNALANNTSGTLNTCIGISAGQSTTTGVRNTIIGAEAAKLNISGYDKIAIGYRSSYNNTANYNNISIGNNSMYNNTSDQNIGIGNHSLYNNTTGGFNLGIGHSTLYTNINTNYCTAIGQNSMYYTNNSTGGNTGVGINTLEFQTTGGGNTALGHYAQNGTTTGSNNVGIGVDTLFFNYTGSGNTAIGTQTLANCSGGFYNVGVGYRSGYNTTNNITNSIAIGPNTKLTTNNTGILKFATTENSTYPSTNTFWFGDSTNGFIDIWAKDISSNGTITGTTISGTTITVNNITNPSGILINSKIDMDSSANIMIQNDSYYNNVIILSTIGLDSSTSTLINYAAGNKRKILTKGSVNNITYTTNSSFPQTLLNLNSDHYFYYPTNGDLTDTMNFFINGGTIEFIIKSPASLSGTNQYILSIYSATGYRLMEVYTNNDVIYFKMNTITISSTYTASTYYYYALCFNNSTSFWSVYFGDITTSTASQIYLNGIGGSVSSTPNLVLGAYDTSGTLKFAGSISNIRFTSSIARYSGTSIPIPTKYYYSTYLSQDGNINISGTITASALNISGSNAIPNAPIGSVIQFTGTAAPTGWLICDGGAISRTTYSALFTVIGTTYGSGNTTTTFNIPDLRTRVPVGLNASGTFSTLGASGGAETVTLIESQIPAHSHFTVFNSYLSSGVGYPIPMGASGSGVSDGRINPIAGGADTNGNTDRYRLVGSSNDANVGPASTTGGGGSHNNLQPYIVVNYIIFTGVNLQVTLSNNTGLDATITSATSGQVLSYNGTNWINKKIETNDISGIVITSATSGQVLSYNGTNWINRTIPIGGSYNGYIVGAFPTANPANATTGNVFSVPIAGTYIINSSIGAYKQTSPGIIQINIWINGINTTYSLKLYANEINSHKALIPISFAYSLNAGNNYLYFQMTAGATSDISDFASFSWMYSG